jgi:hypothetical protein
MFCPEYRVLHVGRLSLWLWASCDTRWKYVPRNQKLNPFRYELVWNRGRQAPFVVNREGRAWLHIRNFLFAAKHPFGKGSRLGYTVYPDMPRSKLGALLVWPLVLLTTLAYHPRAGVRYAARWANASMNPPRATIGGGVGRHAADPRNPDGRNPGAAHGQRLAAPGHR